MNGEDAYLQNRVNMPTAKSSAEIARDIPAQIRARSFFSARVAEAHILERFRRISDDYNTGKIGRDEARALMREFARAEGKDDGSDSLKNLAGTARLELIIDQNAKMAHAVGEHERMYSPAALEAFPFVRYHASVGSKAPRSEHQKYDGMIFDKNDPWLTTHTPPWEFGCNCQLEQITAKAAGKTPDLIQPMTPPDQVKVESKSGFTFNPAHAFETSADLSSLQPISRKRIVEEAAEAVKDQRLGSCGLIAAPVTAGEPPAPLPNLPQVNQAFQRMKSAARQELVTAGLDPNHLPDYQKTNDAVGKNIPGLIRDSFPKEPIEVTKLNHRAADAAGLPDNVPVMLGRGNAYHGIEHLWRNHKELFVDPETAIRLLRETLGDPNCRVVVSLKRATANVPTHGTFVKEPICLRRIVLHNPQTRTYCVMVYDGKELKLVSWNNAGDDYGKGEWTLT